MNEIIYAHQYLDKAGEFSIVSENNFSITNPDGSQKEHPGLSISDIQPGTWLHFKASVPSGPHAACMLMASSQAGDQPMEIRLGAPDAPAAWTVRFAQTPMQSIFRENLSNSRSDIEAGEHDVYLFFPKGFTGCINWFVMCQNLLDETREAGLRRMQWFTDNRFGHMMHWGAYSVLGRGEWVMYNENIPKEEYVVEACEPFNPLAYDPDTWADIIAAAGQKYLTITTKHHDGFSMFETNVIDFAPYDSVNTSACHASLLRPLAEACRKRGIKFAVYYSLLDWGNASEVFVEADAADDLTGEDAAATAATRSAQLYVSQMKEQIKELLEIFDPALLWFDGGWAACMTAEVSNDLYWFIRRIAPDIIINNRIGGSTWDYATPEQSIPVNAQSGLWETCMTMNNSWSFKNNDQNWKSTEVLLANLMDCASKGGNYLLNTGPSPDGVIPEPCVERLGAIGQWLAKWGSAVYGTRAGTLGVSAQAGAYCTMKPPGISYITALQDTPDGMLRVACPQNAVTAVYWLDEPEQAVSWQRENGYVTVVLTPALQRDPLGVVLVIETDGWPEPKCYPDKAQFRKATASSVWFDQVDVYGPQFAVDGNAGTRWASMQGQEPCSLEIDLGAAESIDSVSFSQFEQDIETFRILGESNGEWHVLLEGDRPPRNFEGRLPGGTLINKVRLEIDSTLDGQGVSLWSFSLFDANDTRLPVMSPANLARSATATASSVWYESPQYSPACAVDGNPSTRWATMDGVTEAWISLDLGRELLFDAVRISEFLGQLHATRIAEFKLQVRVAEEWHDVHSGTDASLPITLKSGVQARELRLFISKVVGADGPSILDISVLQTVQPPLPVLSDEALMEAEARACFDYFWREANTTPDSVGYGLIANRHGSRTTSIACTGFGLSGIVIAVERGWVSKEAGADRVRASLHTLLYEVPHHGGFFYHFMDMDTLVSTSEVSTVDSMLALNGILTAGQYFGGDIGELAQAIFDRVDWNLFLNPVSRHFYMAWTPEEGFSAAEWGGYAEQFCMYPLAAGSSTHCPESPEALFYKLGRPRGHYADGGDVVYVNKGALFTYQFSHAWIDFRKVVDRQGVDWWENSVRASQANRQFCMDCADVFPSLGENAWGLTACDTPQGYGVSGAPPSGPNGLNERHTVDGTVTPSGPLGSIVFTPDSALASMRYFYEKHPKLWSTYGFLQSYNLSVPQQWYSNSQAGLIKGITLLMIENYRSGLIWQQYMQHPVLQRGLPAIFDMP